MENNSFSKSYTMCFAWLTFLVDAKWRQYLVLFLLHLSYVTQITVHVMRLYPKDTGFRFDPQ